MLNQRLRAQIQKTVQRTLKDRARIERERKAVDQYGSPVTGGWDVVADDMPCRVISANRSTGNASRMAADQETIEQQYQLIVPEGVTLGVDHRVTVLSALDGEARTYYVIRITDGWTDKVFNSYVVANRDG